MCLIGGSDDVATDENKQNIKKRVETVLNKLSNRKQKRNDIDERNVSVYNFWFSESVVECLERAVRV